MKRFLLTIFFATYYMFMPFVMVNCGSGPGSSVPTERFAKAVHSAQDNPSKVDSLPYSD